jgi:hypothetical protein
MSRAFNLEALFGQRPERQIRQFRRPFEQLEIGNTAPVSIPKGFFEL